MTTVLITDFFSYVTQQSVAEADVPLTAAISHMTPSVWYSTSSDQTSCRQLKC